MRGLVFVAAVVWATAAHAETAWCPPDEPAMLETISTRDGFSYARIAPRWAQIAVTCVWLDRAGLVAECTDEELVITDGEYEAKPEWSNTYTQRLLRFDESDATLEVQFSGEHPLRTFTRCG